jgi:rod shape-determining protein MreB and related proteins
MAMIFDKFYDLFSNDIGIDLGTSNTLVYVKGQGIVLSEPSVVAINAHTRKIVAVGQEAKKMIGKTPEDTIAVRPMKDGVISDYETVEKMIRYFMQKAHNRKTLLKPRVVIGIPAGITEVEKRAVKEAVLQAGAREDFLIQQSMASAIGSNLPIQEPAGNMIVDIGGGTTEIAVISLGGMVLSNSIRIGGDEFNEAIIKFLIKKYNLIVGEQTAEQVKIEAGSAFPFKGEKKMRCDIKGRDSLTGLPKSITLDAPEIRKALIDPLNQIIDAVKSTLNNTPPELASDICERGIVMSGGGSLLRGIDQLVSKTTNVPVILSENPLTSVVLGAGKYLEEIEFLNKSAYKIPF